MRKLTIEFEADNAKRIGYAWIPDVAFPVAGIINYLKDQGYKECKVYFNQSGYGIQDDVSRISHGQDMDYIVTEAIRNLKYYNHKYDNLRRAYSKMGPNYQDLLTRPRTVGRLMNTEKY